MTATPSPASSSAAASSPAASSSLASEHDSGARGRHATVEEIRQRFDNDVERFSSLETGQAAAVDSPLCTRLIAQAAAAVNPRATRVLDVGCGAGNYTLVLLQQLARRNVHVTLLDLSLPMLQRAVTRVSSQVDVAPVAVQCDIREAALEEGSYDIIMAAAVLHHLRSDDEWDAVFARCHALLAPGGSMWIYDMITHDHPAIAAMMTSRHAEYLTQLGGSDYQRKVFDYIAKEDTPRSLADQTMRMKNAGFAEPVVLHVNSCFAAFGAVRPTHVS